VDCTFTGGKFREVVFAFPGVEGCSFDCDITNVDFDGSQLKNCKFSGILDKVIFRRRAGTRTRFRPENKMEHVDFSQAVLHDVDFWTGVSLMKCIFPNKPGMFLVLDGPRVFAKVRKEIESSWDGEDRTIGLGFTMNYYLDRAKDGQKHFLMDEESFADDWGVSLGHRYVSLIREVGRSLGAIRDLNRVHHNTSSNEK
jgi:hypothetical protein